MPDWSQAAIDAGIPKPYPSYTGSVAQALRPFPQFQNIVVWGSQFGSANYHAMQLNFQKRTGDLAFLIAYTASKQIADTDYQGWTGQGSVIRQHPHVLHLSREVLRKDRPKILNHYCPAKSRIESAGWGHRVSFLGKRTAARPVKWAFSRIGCR